jgi:hypothetical protein
MAGHRRFCFANFGGGADYTVCLDAADGAASACVGENIFISLRVYVPDKKGNRLGKRVIHGDNLALAGFALGHRKLPVNAPVVKIVNIVPSKPQHIAYAKRGVNTRQKQQMVAVLVSIDKV